MSMYAALKRLFSPSYAQSLRKNLPILDENFYWGPGSSPKVTDESIRPFKVDIKEEVLNDLQLRLKNTRRFTPPLENIAQEYGFNTNLLKNIIDFWKDEYNWREREIYLNQFPQFKTNIQGLDIHYLHVKPTSLPSHIEIYPLLILHGWPGSVREFYNLIPLLTKPMDGKNFAFEVIAPSIPGYAFSDASAKPGFAVPHAAVAFMNLMKRLGFDRYYLQGGDWGSQITTSLVSQYPKNVLGLHINMCISLMSVTLWKIILGSFWPSIVGISKEDQSKMMYPLSRIFKSLLAETGYYHIQATKPDTIGTALNDSPAGLAAYILEKFSTGTNPNYRALEDGGLLEKFTYTDLLDNVMLYWVTNSATTAARFYAEQYSKENRRVNIDSFQLPKEVPIAFLKAPYEIMYQPDSLLRDRYPNIVQSTELTHGGHFLALEEPQTLAADLFSAVEKMRISRK
ncbi:juvenile hormone epoxide hydrolase 2 [Agrilus planipennis]|uniref:Epoxide hydrolase n=1 Tax=Agrilus planipennis TaxID=224129 RepID=A0A7F5R7N9_AGRPL|nr:juvenile hormone epoxide hydrolase 2 [Agrilus planipennis]